MLLSLSSLELSSWIPCNLHTAREPLKADLGATALKHVDIHPALIFDMQTAFVGKPEYFQKESICLLMRDVRAFADSPSLSSRSSSLCARRGSRNTALDYAPGGRSLR